MIRRREFIAVLGGVGCSRRSPNRASATTDRHA